MGLRLGSILAAIVPLSLPSFFGELDDTTLLPRVRTYGPRVTATKNIGKDWVKPVWNSRYRPHQGQRERDRHRRRYGEG